MKFLREYRFKRRKSAVAVFFAAAVTVMCTTGAYAAPVQLVPSGEAVGMSITSDGAVVNDVVMVNAPDGQCSPAADAGVMPGDIIVKMNGREIDCSEDVRRVLDEEGTQPVTLHILRSGAIRQMSVKPVADVDGVCRLGISLRDGLSGIGTVTWFDPDTGAYAALGHPVSDNDNGTLIPVGEGTLYPATISGANIGKAGKPGQLIGTIDRETPIGTVTGNTAAGISGELIECPNGGAMPVAQRKEIRIGDAEIISTVNEGGARRYDVKIIRIYDGAPGENRNLMIQVTDPELIAATGGIVQGMSGSPIIQDGKLVGAVTHVLINDPTKGYGIFIENMLDAAG